MKVEALDCSFSLPLMYEVKRSHEGDLLFHGELGNVIRIKLLEPKSKINTKGYNLIKSEKVKHMTIEYYNFSRSDNPEIYDLVNVRALREMGQFTRVPKKLMKSVIKQCKQSVKDAVIEAKKRDLADCPVKVNYIQDSFALLKPARPQPVFQNGKARSLRFYSVPETGFHKSIGLQDADELMSLCGISTGVGLAAAKPICCDARDDGKIELVFHRKGKELSVLLSGESLKNKN